MKKAGLVLLILTFCFILLSCGSTDNPVSDLPAEESIIEIPEYFYNWQYKGFGAELPQWIFAALSGDKAAVASYFGKESVEVAVFEAENLDLSENLAKEYEKKMSFPETGDSEVTVLERFWVSTITDEEKYTSEDEKFYSIRIISNLSNLSIEE